MPMPPDVLVIGGGIAGLSAAVDLTSRGWSVMLAEEKQHLGGRVYSFIDSETGDEVDNGQHLMMGCYHQTLRLLDTIGSRKWCSILDPLAISFRDGHQSFAMRAPALPAPLHMFGALFGLKTLTMKERVALLGIAPSLLFSSASAEARLGSMTVAEWLDASGQSERAKKHLWNILAVGTLNERPEHASAALFVRVLRAVLLGSPKDASVVLPRRGLSRIFGDPALVFIRSLGGHVALQTRVSDVTMKGNRIASVRAGGEVIEPRAVISAVPQFAVRRLFTDDALSRLQALGQTERFDAVPIVSIHLWFDRYFMQEEFTALINSPIDWIFNRTKITARPEEREDGREGGRMYLSLVVSAARALAQLPKEEIVRRAVNEVRRFYPEAVDAPLVHSLVVKEKRATFSPRTGVEAWRPGHTTEAENFFLAGDWTDTKLPATIEGAAQSGFACAEAAHAWLTGASQRKK